MMEEERKVKLNITTAREWYRGYDKKLKKMALEAYSIYELTKRKIKVDTPMMCSDTIDISDFCVRFYAGMDKYDNKRNNVHCCYANGLTSEETYTTEVWNYIIPFDKFNPLNIEESLKYDIQRKRINE